MKMMKIVGSAVAATLLAGFSVQAADTASVSGKITLDGAAPKMKKIKADADPVCASLHADKPMTSEEVLVGADGALQNVFVYVKSGLAGKTYEAPKESAIIDQHGCQYRPHVFGMMVGQVLEVKNSDETSHNIHAMPKNNDEFNKAQPASSPNIKRKFPKAEIMVPFKCDVHPWMGSYVGVMENPFFATTGADGAFSLKNLPAGDYEIGIWHEKYGEQTAKVKVGDGESKTQDFKFKAE